MKVTGIPVNKSNWVALRAKYELDANIQLLNKYSISHDGYTTYLQPIYTGGRDIALNKQSLFCLPKSLTLFDFMKDLEVSGIPTAAHGHLSVIIDDIKYYVGVTSCSFPYLKLITRKNDDTFFSIRPVGNGLFEFAYKNDLFVTVSNKEPYMLYVSTRLDSSDNNRQQFVLNDLGNNKFSFFTNISDSFNTTTQRAWSYRNVGKYKKFVRANGIILDSEFNIFNDSVFTGEGLELYISKNGLRVDHTWVSYLREHDRDPEVKLENSPTNIAIHHLTDLPYNSKTNIEAKELTINIANTKSVMTDQYEYKVNSSIIAPNPLYEQEPFTQCCDTDVTIPSQPIHSTPNDLICGHYDFKINPTYANTTTDWRSFKRGKFSYYARRRNGCVRRLVWAPKTWTSSVESYLTNYNFIWRLAKYTSPSKTIPAEFDLKSTTTASSRPYSFSPLDQPKGLYPSTYYFNDDLDANVNYKDKFLTRLYNDNPADLNVNDVHAIVATVYTYYYVISDGVNRITTQFGGYDIDYCIYTENSRTSLNIGQPTKFAAFTFNLNINTLQESIVSPIVDPPCPRVNSWSVDYASPIYYTGPGNYVDKMFTATPSGSVDIYSFIDAQEVSVTYTGPGILLTSYAGVSSEQLKTSVYYTIPGTYDININVISI